VFIFLAAGLHSILPTVLSRCVVYKLKPHTDEDVRKALTRLGLPDQGVAFAQGNIGKAIEIASSERFAAMASLAEEVTQTIRGLDILSAMALYRRFEEYKDSVGLLLDMLYINFSHIAVECVDSIVTAKKALERNGSFQLTIELMLIELTGRYGPGDMR
jgi:DNA polymerase-3 subunit delta'